MSINFTAKNVKLTDSLREAIESKLAGLEKISGPMISAEVMLQDEKNESRVEISLKTDHRAYHVEGRNGTIKQALTEAMEKLKTQARKDKEKEVTHDKKKIPVKEVFKEESVVEGDDREVGPVTIELSASRSRKPLTVEEAVFFLQECEENAYMFENADTHRWSVVFRNGQGGVSLIEADK